MANVSNFPFGYNKPEEPDDGDEEGGSGNSESDRGSSSSPHDPLGLLSGLSGSMNPQDMSAMLHRFADLMSWQGGPVNWDLAKETARHGITQAGDPAVSDREREQVAESVRLADHWLDPTTVFPSGVNVAEAWSRADWIEGTVDVWAQLCDPVAGRVVESMGSVVPEEMQSVAGPLLGIVRQMGGMMFGGQAGQALGELAQEVVSSTDVGLPLGPQGKAALLPRNVAGFGEGLGVPDDQLRLYLALREAAHHRLFARVPWLVNRLLGAVEDYARGISVDTSRLEEAVNNLDPNNPQELQQALASGVFTTEQSPQQQAALTRLETQLALVEGWVDTVVNTAAEGKLPAAEALAETVRRRRATGGPAERTFATLVGLELRPRRLRDAAALWRTLGAEHGISERDGVWGHPDLMPAAEDLDDPEGFARRSSPDIDISALTDEAQLGSDDEPGPGDEGRSDQR